MKNSAAEKSGSIWEKTTMIFNSLSIIAGKLNPTQFKQLKKL